MGRITDRIIDSVVGGVLDRYRRYKRKLSQSLHGLPTSTCLFLFLALTLASPNAYSLSISPEIPYYGEDFYRQIQQRDLKDEKLISMLREILVRKHIRQDGRMDKITDSCDMASRGCYGHNSIGYKTARKVIMGKLHLDGSGKAVHEVYCQKMYTRSDFSSGPYPGPDQTPNDRILNVEHTWPQSRFNHNMEKSTQKADLHHLFPTHSEMNRIRGNMKFGEVEVPEFALPCPESKMGHIRGSSADFFEPPDAHKGNVARALFYFSIRYKLKIDPVEERFIRDWHKEDPVDEEEKERNEKIQQIQGNRNPFIDFPELVALISDF